MPRSASPNPYGAPPSAYGAQPGYPQNATPGYATAVGGQYPPASYPPLGAGAGEVQPMPAPEGFSRPPSLAQPYTRFEAVKIQDMDDFFENIPRMPLVLVPHDVYHEDWIRLMTVRLLRMRFFRRITKCVVRICLSPGLASCQSRITLETVVHPSGQPSPPISSISGTPRSF